MTRIYVRRPLADRFWEKVAKSDSCWLWTAALDHRGYGKIGIPPKRIRTAHRVAWELTFGPIAEGLHCLHHCDTPACVRPDHLFLGTNADNQADMYAKGRGARGETSGPRLHPESISRGEAHGMARLTEATVLAIRSQVAGGVAQKELAAHYRVSKALVCLIVNRKVWTHI